MVAATSFWSGLSVQRQRTCAPEHSPMPGEPRAATRVLGRIRLTYTSTNLEAHNRLAAKFRGLLDTMRCKRDLIERAT